MQATEAANSSNGPGRPRRDWPEDPRITGYLEAREQAARAGAGADARAGAEAQVRERELLPGYLAAHAAIAPPARRKSLMRELVQDFSFPLGAVLAAFKATSDEAAYARDGSPLQSETADEITRLRQMPYEHYLKTGHWERTRAEALARAEGFCQLGGRKCDGALQVHHRDTEAYERRGQERPADLTVLCTAHHRQVHEPLGGE